MLKMMCGLILFGVGTELLTFNTPPGTINVASIASLSCGAALIASWLNDNIAKPLRKL